MHELAEQLLSYLNAAWRYRWYGLIGAWLLAIVGWVAVAKIPDRYQASARVYVDTQSVLRPLLAGVAVTPNLDQMISMMSRTLISRPNMAKVIQMADLDLKVKTPEERELLIDRLTRELTIRGAGAENLYSIEFSDPNPQQAQRVVQSLLTIFVEGSLGSKRDDSDSARRFLDAQLKAYSDKLAAAEASVVEFRRNHMDMSGDGQSYYSRMTQAQDALNQATLELREAENSRTAMAGQLKGDTPVYLNDFSAEAAPSSEFDGRIADLQKQLDSLRLRYTEKHPDIIAISEMIKELKAQKQQEAKTAKRPSPNQALQNPVYQQLSVALAEAEAQVAAKKARVAEYTRRYDQMRAQAHDVPEYDAQFTQLTRDYEVTKNNYQSLLARSDSAQITRQMETTTNVMDFRVIDPPQVPSVPSAPNRPVLISMVFLAALGFGGALAFVISQLRPTVISEKNLREVAGLPVLGTVVMEWTEAQGARRKKGLIAFFTSLLGLLSVYAGVIAIYSLAARV